MPAHHPLLIPGARPSEQIKTVTSPFDLKPLATLDSADWPTLEAALERAHALFVDRDRWLPPARRIEILRRVAVMLREERETLAVEAAREGGKPLVDSLVEVDRAIDGIELCVQTLRTQAGVNSDEPQPPRPNAWLGQRTSRSAWWSRSARSIIR